MAKFGSCFLSGILDAVERGNLGRLQELLLKDFSSTDLCFDDYPNDTVLQKACREGYCEIVNELLINRADVNAKNQNGCTALILASLNGNYEIVIELVNRGAEVNLQDTFGWTALMTASRKGHYEIVRVLLNYHADPNIQANDGLTALMLASNYKRNQIVMELINHNADVNLQNRQGNTALHSLLLEKVTDTTIEIVKLLLSDITSFVKVNKRNKSVMQLVRESQNQEILQLMEDILERKKINAAKRELKKLQANQIINKRKKKLLEVSALKDETLDLERNIDHVKRQNTELKEQLKKNSEKVRTWEYTLKNKKENEELKSYEKLKEDIEYFERCIEMETFDSVIQLEKRECPICFNEMKPNKKIYQCQSGHILCEDCFGRIKKKDKICPFCKIDIVSNPIRCRALEDVIDEEANK